MPPPIQIPEEQSQALSADIRTQLDALPAAITDAGTYRLAKESLPLLKRYEDKVVTFFKDIKEAANRTHKSICAKENEQLIPIKSARQRLSTLIYSWEQEQARLQREAEQRAGEEERRRQQESALAEAAAISSSDPVTAEQIVEQAIALPAPVIVLPSAQVDVSGVSSSQNWQWDFGAPDLDWDHLPQADRDRVMRLLPREYCRPDEKAIGKIVKALKGATRIPGIRVFDKGTVRTRG